MTRDNQKILKITNQMHAIMGDIVERYQEIRFELGQENANFSTKESVYTLIETDMRSKGINIPEQRNDNEAKQQILMLLGGLLFTSEDLQRIRPNIEINPQEQQRYINSHTLDDLLPYVDEAITVILDIALHETSKYTKQLLNATYTSLPDMQNNILENIQEIGNGIDHTLSVSLDTYAEDQTFGLFPLDSQFFPLRESLQKFAGKVEQLSNVVTGAEKSIADRVKDTKLLSAGQAYKNSIDLGNFLPKMNVPQKDKDAVWGKRLETTRNRPIKKQDMNDYGLGSGNDGFYIG